MLRRVTLAGLELREVLNHSLHILNGTELGLTLLRAQECLYEGLNLRIELSIVGVLDFLEEGIINGRKDDFFHFFRKVFQMFQIDAVVLDPDQLVHHGLVRPLVEQGSDWVFSPIDDE